MNDMVDADNQSEYEGSSVRSSYTSSDRSYSRQSVSSERPRAQRVAPSARTGSSRIHSVDMTSVQTSYARRSISDDKTISQSRRQAGSALSNKNVSSRNTETGYTQRKKRSSVPDRNSNDRLSSAQNRRRTSGQHSGSDGSSHGNKSYSSILENRKKSPSQGSNARKKTTNKKKGSIKKFVITYSAAMLLIIIVASIVFTVFLSRYESVQPANEAAKVVEYFSSSDSLRSFLTENDSILNQDTADLNYDDEFIEKVNGKEIAYFENVEKTSADNIYYNIKADNSTVATIGLSKSDPGAFGLSSWYISSIDTTPAFEDAKTYTILVPDGSTVTVNGKTLSDSLITATGIPEVLKYSSEFMTDVPEYTTYTVKVLSDNIEVSGQDSDGTELTFSSNETSFVAGGKANDEFISQVSTLVETALREYALYFIYQAFNLSDYIHSGCDTYAYIFGSDEYDPINPWLYNFEYIDTYDFTEFEAKNYVIYSDDCFSVDVKYNLVVSFTRSDMDDDIQTLDVTWIFVRDGDSWSIVDSISN